MPKVIRTDSLADSIARAKEEATAFKSVIEASVQEIEKLAKIFQSKRVSLDKENAKDLEKINQEYKESLVLAKARKDASDDLRKSKAKEIKLEKDLAKALIAETKANEKAEKLNKKLNTQKKAKTVLTDEEIKQSIITRKENAAKRKQLEAEIILEQKSIKNKQDLRDQIKALNIAGSKLDLGSEELAENVRQINKLTDQLSENGTQREQNIINIGNYKSATEGLTDSFKDQEKRLSILTEVYRDSIIQNGKWSRTSRQLRRDLQAQKETLEDVKEATEDTEKASKKLGNATKALGLGVLIAVAVKIKEFFGTSREASLESEKAFANFTESVRVFFAALVNAWDGAKVIFFSVVESLKTGFLSVEIGFNKLLLTIAEAKDFFGDYSSQVNQIKNDISALETEQSKLSDSTNTLASGVEKISSAFTGVTETTSNAIAAQQKYLELQLATEISIERQTRGLAGLQERRQILQDISDDDTLGFETRAIAVQKAQDSAISFAEKEERLLITKEKLTIEAVKQDLRVSKALSESDLGRIKTGEQLITQLNRRSIALKVSSENEAAFTEAFTERIDKAVEVQAFQRDQEEKFRKTFRDDYEQRLDIIEEFAEVQFARNSELIANDRLTQSERARIFADNEKISRELLDESTRLTLEQGKSSIDLNDNLTTQEKELAKAKLDSLDIDKLVAINNQQEIFDIIRRLDLGEIEEKRLKESIKIRREQLEVNKENALVLEESEKRALELRKDTDAQEELLNDETIESAEDLEEALERLDQKRFDNKVELLRKEISLLEDGSNLKLEKEKELNDLLIEDPKRVSDANKEEQEPKKKRQEENTEFVREQSLAAANAVIDGLIKQSEARQKDLEDDVTQTQTRRSELQAIADSSDGVASQKAADSLAKQRQLEREKKAEIEEEIKRQQRLKIVSAGLDAYAANAGQPNAISKTITDVGILIAGLNAVSGSFYEGTDRLGSVSNPTDKNGGRIIEAHDDEMIIQGSLNKKMGFPDRYDVADVFTRYKDGELVDNVHASQVLNNIVVNNNNDEIVREIRSLKNHIKQSSNPELLVDAAKGIIAIKERNGTRINKYIEHV